MNLRRIRRLGGGVRRKGETLLDFPDADLLMMHPGHQPASDIAPAGNRRDIVEVMQQTGSCERLDNAEIERGAADTSARKGQPDERIARRPARWRFVQTEPPGRFDLLEFVTENVLEGERTHCYLARSAYLTQ